jgi:hypothetical protein
MSTNYCEWWLTALDFLRMCLKTWFLGCAWREVGGSGCSCILRWREGGKAKCCKYGPWVSPTHLTILISVSGLDQIHCAFCWEWTGLKTLKLSISLGGKTSKQPAQLVACFCWFLAWFILRPWNLGAIGSSEMPGSLWATQCYNPQYRK